ncbi:MAG: LytTR family DNA-binding domain-containing protein [Agriterribacter sp.]
MDITAVIVDDEPHAIEILQKYAAQIPGLRIVATCPNAISAFQVLQNNQVNLMFIDIKMPGLSGTDLVRSLKTPPMIIFTTAHHEFAVEGFDLNAVDYMVKPIPFSRFLRAIDKVMHFLKGSMPATAATDVPAETTAAKHFLYLRIDRSIVKVDTADICWIESIKDYIKVVTLAKMYITKQKISVAEKLLPLGQFMRVHRSFIIPLNKVERYHPGYLLVAGTKITIGRNYKDACVKQFGPPSSTNP